MSWIGIDTGGTFTDLVLVDTVNNVQFDYKLPTTKANPSEGILRGIEGILRLAELPVEDIDFLVHGTTLATNAVLEGKCAKTGMLVTKGFRDVIRLARQRRPSLYNLKVGQPTPPASRDCRIEIDERLAYDGSVVRPLSEQDVVDAAEALRTKGVNAIAICFLHAYANRAHEQLAKEIVNRAWPAAYVCTSSEVMAEYREFERFATTTINSSLMPVIDDYIERFERGVADLGITVPPRIMQSNGGAVAPETVRKMPVNTFFSGPAGGVIGAGSLSRQCGVVDIITFDMGGTSTDVALLREGRPAMSNQREMAGYPVRSRMLDIHTIGAGGGSIAWVDPGGMLKVGPQSAGSEPGPAAYGRGGTLPTVTDANMVLGRLNPRAILGGRMQVYPERSREVVAHLAERLGMDVESAAAGIIEIVNVNMMGAVRVISVEQGQDPRGFALVAFGGAGPLHGVEVARDIGMSRVIVPESPGLLSALGLLHADSRSDFSITRPLRAEPESLGSLAEGLQELRRRALAWLADESFSVEAATFSWMVDMRYVGQNFELLVPIQQGSVDTSALEGLLATFHRMHENAYGHSMPERSVETVTLRLAVSIPRPKPIFASRRQSAATVGDACAEERLVWFKETGFVQTPVYDRFRLPRAASFEGPAIIEQMDTTTVVTPQSSVVLDAFGNLMITVNNAASGVLQ